MQDGLHNDARQGARQWMLGALGARLLDAAEQPRATMMHLDTALDPSVVAAIDFALLLPARIGR